MKKVIIYLSIIILIACQRKENSISHFFDQYTQDNTLYSRNRLLITISPSGRLENKITIEGQPGKYWLYEEFYERHVDGEGLYRRFEDNYSLWYRFDSLVQQQNIKSPKASLFFYDNIVLSDKKAYEINGRQFNIYAYAENSGSAGIISYYLDKFGFFAYDLNNGYYLLCNRSSEDEHFNQEILNVICDSLIRDKHFFSIYRFYPNNSILTE